MQSLTVLQEFYYTVGATVFYFIAMIVQFAIAAGYDDSGTAAAVRLIMSFQP